MRKRLRVIVYDSSFDNNVKSLIYNPSNSDIVGGKDFMKGIHLKGEIGFFIYYKEVEDFPTVSIQICNSNNSMSVYSSFDEIKINKSTYQKNNLLNDVVKLNNNQVCFVSTTSDKYSLNIIVFSLYKDDTLMNIRYYQVEMWESHHQRIYLDLKIDLYKNFLSIAYSHCSQIECFSAFSHPHKSSLIILNYAISMDNSLDIIPELYSKNKNIEKDFCFNFTDNVTIENNIFGFVLKGVRVINYYKNIMHLINSTNNEIIEFNSVVLKDECVKLSFPTHQNYQKTNLCFN